MVDFLIERALVVGHYCLDLGIKAFHFVFDFVVDALVEDTEDIELFPDVGTNVFEVLF